MAENFFGMTDKGRMRENNEDDFITTSFSGGHLIAACVIDGVGGYAGGEIAAALAKDTILNELVNASVGIHDMMVDALVKANEKIHHEKSKTAENGQMACVLTLAIADISANKFYYAHIGDTRLYLFRDHTLVKVSHDHSFVGLLEDTGRLTEEAAMKHPKRNEIDKALGFDEYFPAGYIETGESPFLPGDTIMLCSDGLSDMIDNKCITDILEKKEGLETKAGQLIEAANEAGGRDNVTVVLVNNNRSPLKHSATKPGNITKTVAADEAEERTKETLQKNSELAAAPVKNHSRSPLLAIICLCLLGVIAWLLYQRYKDATPQFAPQSANVKKQRNAGELMLSDSIAGGSVTLTLPVADNNIIILTDTIFVDRDSLILKGNGTSLLCDSSYKGAALSFSSRCKYVLLDSVIIDGFDPGIIAQNQVLHLKNVVFRNCSLPMQYQLLLPENRNISGSLSDSLYHYTDSSLH